MMESSMSEIECFFANYARAFSGRDLAGIASACSFPITFYLNDGTAHLSDEAGFYENAAQLIAAYDNLGMDTISFRLVSANEVNRSTMLVEVLWSLNNSEGRELVAFVTRYIVGKQNADLKILGVIVIDEKEKIAAYRQPGHMKTETGNGTAGIVNTLPRGKHSVNEMDTFPSFMLTPENAIPSRSQSEGVKGWIYHGADSKQTAYWICEKDGISREHSHDFEEYFFVIDGEYCLEIHNETIVLKKGDEYYIPAGVPHSGRFTAGTRTFHCFGGRRV